jgi:uncharacterized protein YlaN (UPF0358 family)
MFNQLALHLLLLFTTVYSLCKVWHDNITFSSLVIWTKLNSSVVKSRGQFTEHMDIFMVNLFRNCPIETEKETKFSVKIDIIDSTEGKSIAFLQ